VRPKTWTTYELVVRLHITPYVGAIRVDRLKPEDIRAMMTALEKAGASPRIRELAYLRLRSALEPLIGDVVMATPIRRAHKPRVERSTMTAWTREQARAFLSATEDDPLGPLYRLALATGMRRGELLALQWQDVDLRRRRIAVQHTLTDDGELAPAKTARSRRTIELSPRTAASLKTHRERLLAAGLRASPWVFPAAHGGPYRSRQLQRDFPVAILKANVRRKDPLPTIRFHDLRHTAATIALSVGVHPKIVSEMLGHASITITLDTYSHVLPALQKDAVRRLDSVL
jgi:integrase